MDILLKIIIVLAILSVPVLAAQYVYKLGYKAGYAQKTTEIDAAFQLNVKEKEQIRQEELREAREVFDRISAQPKIVNHIIETIKEIPPTEKVILATAVSPAIVSVLNDAIKSGNDRLRAITLAADANVPDSGKL